MCRPLVYVYKCKHRQSMGTKHCASSPLFNTPRTDQAHAAVDANKPKLYKRLVLYLRCRFNRRSGPASVRMGYVCGRCQWTLLSVVGEEQMSLKA